MKKILLTLSVNALLIPLAFGQKTFSSPAPDSSRVAKETIVIIADDNAGNYLEQRKELKITTLLKLNPLVAANGDLPIYIEQKLGDKISVELAAGFTFKNYIGEFVGSHFSDSDDDIIRTNETGYSFSGALHYFPTKSMPVLEGTYFGPEVRIRNYKFNATSIENFEFDIDQQKIVSDFKMTLGNINFVDDHIFVETYCGLGVRHKSFKNELSSEYVYNEEINEMEYQLSQTDRTSLGPVLSFGFKLGYGF